VHRLRLGEIAPSQKGSSTGKQKAVPLLDLVWVMIALDLNPATSLQDYVELDASVRGKLDGPIASDVEAWRHVKIWIHQRNDVGKQFH